MAPTSATFLTAITGFTVALLVFRLFPVLLSTSSLTPTLLRLFPVLLFTSFLTPTLLSTAEEEQATVANELSKFDLFGSQFTVDGKYNIGDVIIGIRSYLIESHNKREKGEKADE